MKSSDYHYVARQGYIPIRNVLIAFVIICFSLTFPGMALIPAVVAAELSGSEEALPIYEKEVLQKTLNDIKGKLDAGFPVTTELSFLEDIRNELNRHLTEAENAVAELSLTIPDIDMTEFEAEFAEKLDNARRLIYELDNIIINPSIDQIDSVLKLIEILDPEVQGEILATKPELPNRTVDTKVNAFKVRPVKATGAPVTDADLAETPEIVFTEAIIAKAAELNHDVVDIFTWVKFNIDYEPYYGSMKGSNETLVDMAGNDCDQSSFLLALLRASGIPSRYVRGDVELKIEDLMNWTGGKTPEAAIAIMQRNKIPTTIIYKFDAIEGVIFDHIWVEAFDGHNWRLMDPSFKEYVYTEGLNPFDIDEESVRNLFDTAVTTEGNTVSVDQEAINTFSQSLPEATDEILRKREIFVSEKNTLPPYLARGITGDRKPAEEFSTMPESMQVQVKVVMPGGSEYVTPLSAIAGKRVSLIYVAAYAGHQAYLDSIGGIYNLVWPYTAAIRMNPVLQIDGEPVAEGAIIGLAQYQYLQIGFLRPGIYDPSNPVWEETNKPLLSGNRYNICITTQKTSTDELLRLGDEAEASIMGLPLDGYLTDDMIDEKLRLSGMLYFSVVDELSDQVSKTVDVV
ncbi:MAG: transglutaminase-like domain-containing protein, partial [Deltaproteobacteria bacterium]|nr:transglutaminase-like domain-containing protein [Deltaproteobacteria bacterium]